MGYSTSFSGSFKLDKPLTDNHAAYLRQFSETRRMKRNAQKASELPDPCRESVGLPIGPEAAYFVGGTGYAGQDRDDSITDYNNPPCGSALRAGQPGLWCQWVPSEDNSAIEWNEAEKFYNYIEWINYLIQNFLKPWGYKLNGAVEWEGENGGDFGKIIITNNSVKTATGRREYNEEA